jgi:hypothetical protein
VSKLIDSQSNRQIVQVMSKDESHAYGTGEFKSRQSTALPLFSRVQAGLALSYWGTRISKRGSFSPSPCLNWK